MNKKPIGIVTMSLDKWELNEISTSIKKRGYETELISIENTLLDYSKIANSIVEYHVIVGRVERPILQEGLTLLKAYEVKGERIVNSADAIYNSQNKAYCSLYLSKEKIPHPKTIFSFSKDVIVNSLPGLKFPVVLKPWIGGRGVGIVKADTINNAKDFIELIDFSKQPFYVQEFVHNPKSKTYRDMRIFVVGDEAIGAYYREANKDQWKTNICNGGIGRKGEISIEISKMAINAAKAIGADIAGVDIIETADGLAVLEVNICPLFKAFYNTTGINPAEKISDYLINNFN